MKVKVQFYVRLQEITGEKVVNLKIYKRQTVGKILEKLSKRYGKQFRRHIYASNHQIANHLQILVDGINITNLEGLETKLKDNTHLI